jgi:hypothetical protein
MTKGLSTLHLALRFLRYLLFLAFQFQLETSIPSREGVPMTETTDRLEARVRDLERRLRRRQWMSGAVFLLAAALGCAPLLAQSQRTRYAELDVERLNVVEPNGQLVLALANSVRLPNPLIAGKTVKTDRTGPGMIFFDGKGWEVGGLIYGTETTDGTSRAWGHFSFDQLQNDQVVYLSYQDDGKSNKTAGLFVVDRARTPSLEEIIKLQAELANAKELERAALQAKLRGSAAQRIFVGSENETATVRLRDRSGRDRIRLLVDPQGVPRIELLDEAGKVVERLPK